MKFWIRKVVYAAVSWLIPGGKIAAMTAEVLYRIVMFIKFISMEEGLFSKKLERALGKELDDLIDFRKLKLGFLEVFDNKIFSWGIKLIDKHYSDHVPDKFRKITVEFAEAIVAHDWENAKVLVAKLIDILVDIPLVEDKDEFYVIKGAIEALLQVLQARLKKK
jgi:hypothetical protein